ncbi:MAG: hypothetical protein HIU82_01250 [Proteobacteria bacterium]|nr:hypothetical protein [Pseudomonadota bacterium]
MRDRLRLAELMCARMCHDLGGPLGSLTGTLELSQASPDSASVTEAAEALSCRLRLLRAAWGGNAGRLDPPRLRELGRGAPGADRMELDLAALPPRTVFAPGIGRILLNLLLLGPEALPLGGKFSVTPLDDGGMLVRIAGPRAAWPQGFALYLTDPEAAFAALSGPRAVLGPWIGMLAAQLDVRAALLLPSGSGRGVGPAPLLLHQRVPA